VTRRRRQRDRRQQARGALAKAQTSLRQLREGTDVMRLAMLDPIIGHPVAVHAEHTPHASVAEVAWDRKSPDLAHVREDLAVGRCGYVRHDGALGPLAAPRRHAVGPDLLVVRHDAFEEDVRRIRERLPLLLQQRMPRPSEEGVDRLTHA
jgi:hypothetical protein